MRSLLLNYQVRWKVRSRSIFLDKAVQNHLCGLSYVLALKRGMNEAAYNTSQSRVAALAMPSF